MIKSVFVKEVERTNNLHRYFDDIKNYELISAEEEIELITRAQEGEQAAMDKLVMSHQRYIFSFARQYSNGKNVTDLVNVANDGFIEAINRFDVTRGFRLCSYANFWMKERLNKYILNEHQPIKKTNYYKTYSKANKLKNEFFLLNGRYPTTDELLEELKNVYGLTIKNVGDLYDIAYSSINSTLDDGESFFEDSPEFNNATSSYNDYEKTVTAEYNEALVSLMLSGLTEKEQKVIKPLFGIGCEEKDMETVADEMGMTKERIRQLKTSICEKLRSRYDSYYKKKAI